MSKMSKTIAVLGVVAGLGVAALPLSTYAAVTTPETGDPTNPGDNVTLNVKVVDSIQIAVEGDDTVNLTSVNDKVVGDPGQSANATLRVTTGNTKGYTLWAKTVAADGALVEKTDPSKKIASGIPSTSAPVSASAWGMIYEGSDASASTTDFLTYQGLSGANQIVRTTTTAPTTGPEGGKYDDTIVKFGVTTKSGQPAGTYTGTVNFTAAANL